MQTFMRAPVVADISRMRPPLRPIARPTLDCGISSRLHITPGVTLYGAGP